MGEPPQGQGDGEGSGGGGGAAGGGEDDGSAQAADVAGAGHWAAFRVGGGPVGCRACGLVQPCERADRTGPDPVMARRYYAPGQGGRIRAVRKGSGPGPGGEGARGGEAVPAGNRPAHRVGCTGRTRADVGSGKGGGRPERA